MKTKKPQQKRVGSIMVFIFASRAMCCLENFTKPQLQASCQHFYTSQRHYMEAINGSYHHTLEHSQEIGKGEYPFRDICKINFQC